jgi:hypothetical protein
MGYTPRGVAQRLDPATLTLSPEIEIGASLILFAANPTHLLVLTGQYGHIELVRVSAATLQVDWAGFDFFDFEQDAAVFLDDHLWLVPSETDTIVPVAFDPYRLEPAIPLPTAAHAQDLIADASGFWMAFDDDTLRYYDPVSQQFGAPQARPALPGKILAASDHLWLWDEKEATLSRLDALVDQVASLSLGSPLPSPTPYLTSTPYPTDPSLCPAAPPLRLALGESAVVVSTLKIRRTPILDPTDANVHVNLLMPGEEVLIYDGPVCVPYEGGAYWFWSISRLNSGFFVWAGWVAEGAVGQPYLDPLP